MLKNHKKIMTVREESAHIKQALFTEITNNNNIKVFTDGSKTQEACGYDVISNNETLTSRRINSISSIYTAEISAIIQAIKMYNQGSLPVEICTDSLSSITAAQNSLCKEAGAVRLRNLLHAARGKISLTWHTLALSGTKWQTLQPKQH
jgi:RNase H